VIELDGGVHEHQKGYDRLRDAAIRKLGLRVMRFGNDEVMDQLDWVIEKVKASTLPPRSPSPVERGVRGKVG
jgi:very-short-patch-repair endonuclease